MVIYTITHAERIVGDLYVTFTADRSVRRSGGFAFLFRAEIEIPFEAGYHWWYGDDAWEEAVRATGWAVGRACGVPIRHTPNGSASRVWPLLAPLIEADRKRWDEAHQ